MKFISIVRTYKLLFIALALLVAAIGIETHYYSYRFSEKNAREVERIIHFKQQKAQQLVAELHALPLKSTFEDYRQVYKMHRRYAKEQNIHFFVIDTCDLVYWSSNAISIAKDSLPVLSKPLVFFNNAWYLCSSLKKQNRTLCVFTLLKYEYPYQNQFIESKFHDDFLIPNSYTVSPTPQKGSFTIKQANGKFLLSVTPVFGRNSSVIQQYVAIILFCIALFLLMFAIDSMIARIQRLRNKIWSIVFFIAGLVLLRYGIKSQEIPYMFFATDAFKSEYFAFSEFIPSFGDLVLHIIFGLVIVMQFRHVIVVAKIPKQLYVFGVLLISAVSISGIALLISMLLFHSNIHFDLFNILQITYLSVWGSMLMLVLTLLYYYFITKAFLIYPLLCSSKRVVLFCLLILFAFSVGVVAIFGSIGYVIAVFYVISILFVYYFTKQNISSSSIIYKLSILLTSVLFVIILCNIYSQQKHTEVKELLSKTVANEQDPVAEMLLSGVKEQMRADTALQALLISPINQEDKINKYLQKKYFSGFLKRYELESTVCGTYDSVPKTNQLQNCERYFSKIIQTSGIALSNTDYYFLSNQDGTVSYFDSIQFVWANKTITKLYVQLNSKRMSEELGYPQLLLGSDVLRKSRKLEYAYAKYKDGKLLNQNGDYVYPLQLNMLRMQSFGSIAQHTIVNNQAGITIVVTHKKPTIFEYLVWFSYLFILCFLLHTIGSWAQRKFEFSHISTFTDKIRISLIGVLLVSLVLTAVVVIYLNMRQQTESLEKQVREKLQSVLVELNEYAEGLSRLDESKQEEMQAMLLRYSNVFFTDINFYNPQGILYASSRPEIFDLKLIGAQMNSRAYYSLVHKKTPEVLVTESIGSLEYASAYTMLTNEKNEVLGYVNVPYVTKQNEHTEQIASLIAAILNIYVVLLMLTTLFAVMISKRITQPLLLLRDTIQKFRIGNTNEKIEWKSKDEIGDLIGNYNAMIDTLDSNVKKLAESEREGAWREMAKQIAHEIKNPLTPMKLNMQLLQRMWAQKDANFSERLDRVSATMIEQIDALAATATSFSNFAKLSELQPETVYVNDLLQNVVVLFQESEGVEVRLQMPNDSYYVFIDKEKLLRVCNNIIKNAIQSIPNNKQGLVQVALQTIDERICISIRDNGVGIPLEIQDRMFEPHFTTKSTGSGLGLAICKKIIDMSGGSIEYTTTENEGTTFTVYLPLHNLV